MINVIFDSLKYFAYLIAILVCIILFCAFFTVLLEHFFAKKMGTLARISGTAILTFLTIFSFVFGLTFYPNPLPGIILPIIVFIILGAFIATWAAVEYDETAERIDWQKIFKFFKTINGIVNVYNYIYKNNIPIPDIKPSRRERDTNNQLIKYLKEDK